MCVSLCVMRVCVSMYHEGVCVCVFVCDEGVCMCIMRVCVCVSLCVMRRHIHHYL